MHGTPLTGLAHMTGALALAVVAGVGIVGGSSVSASVAESEPRVVVRASKRDRLNELARELAEHADRSKAACVVAFGDFELRPELRGVAIRVSWGRGTADAMNGWLVCSGSVEEMWNPITEDANARSFGMIQSDERGRLFVTHPSGNGRQPLEPGVWGDTALVLFVDESLRVGGVMPHLERARAAVIIWLVWLA